MLLCEEGNALRIPLHRQHRSEGHDSLPKIFQPKVFVFAVLVVVEMDDGDRDNWKAESFGKWSHGDRTAHRADAHRHLIPSALDDIRDFERCRMIHLGPVRFGYGKSRAYLA